MALGGKLGLRVCENEKTGTHSILKICEANCKLKMGTVPQEKLDLKVLHQLKSILVHYLFFSKN